MTQCTVFLRSLDDTDAFARALLTSVPPVSVIALVGDLGSGKTTFAQAIGRELHLDEPMTSPTFTLVNHYQAPSRPLVHGDFYRLDDYESIGSLGVSDHFGDPNTLTIIEWADRARPLFPPQTLWLTWRLCDAYRTVTIDTQSDTIWQKLQKVL
jgi:tRNA threonylcarbamoyladenosine biosynthesis protein TsaE